jgi:hypothetical protein
MAERTDIKRFVRLIRPQECNHCHRPLEDGWAVQVREEWREDDSIFMNGEPIIIPGLSKLAAEMIYSRELLNGAKLETY